jgi:hypothetical protein
MISSIVRFNAVAMQPTAEKTTNPNRIDVTQLIELVRSASLIDQFIKTIRNKSLNKIPITIITKFVV